MIRKGLILCILTFLMSALVVESVVFGMGLVSEFEHVEKVETLEISDIHIYDNGARDLVFKNSETGRDYYNTIFTYSNSYEIGDKVEVVTRNDTPKELLSETKRNRPRNTVERLIDVGCESGMTMVIALTALLILLFGIPSCTMIPEEIERRKKFFIINTSVYAFIIVLGCIYMILSETSHSWDGLGYAIISLFLFFIGVLELLISWLVNSIVLKIKEKRKAENTH